MKKIIVSGALVSVLMFAAVPVFADTLPSAPVDQTTVLIQIAQQILVMITNINQSLTADESAIANLQSRMTALEAKSNVVVSVPAPVVGSTGPTQADLDAVAVIRNGLPDTVQKACTIKAGVERRTYDRIYNLMCTLSNF